MKKLLVFFMISVFCVFYSEGKAFELIQTVNFSKSSLVFEKEKEYDLVKLSQAYLMNQIGKPALPVKNIFLVLPDNAEVVGVEVISTEKEKLSESFYIFPAQPSIPLSQTPDPNSFVQPLSRVYNSSLPFPETPIQYLKTGLLGGKKIAVLQVHPLEYIPAQRSLVFYKDIQYRLNYTLKDKVPSPPRRSQKAEETYLSMVKRMVENPQDISPSSLRQNSDEGLLEYLVITNETLSPYFQELVDWKRKKGISSAIRTREWIDSNYSGYDRAERIRNYLKIAYQDSGCVWVLLGGDTDVIPCRYAHIELQTETEDIPSDLYYSDLDRSWDYNGDHIYGEPGDSLDLFPDLFVGRAPASTTSEVEVFVDKVLAYEKSVPSDYQLKMLFFAEYGDARTDDAIHKDMIDDYYVPSRFDPISKLYERDGNENAQAVLDSMDLGFNFLNHAGHANYPVMCTGPDNIWNDDIDGLTNSPRFFGVLYSVGCWPAAIDYDCIAEHFVKNADGGGFFVGNSRYGWYTPSLPGYGSSDLFDQQFFASVFNRGFYHLGQVVSDSKTQFAADADQENDFRWIEFELILLGDPEMPLWTNTPENLIVDFADTVTTGSNQFWVTVTQGSPVEDALVCLMKDNEVFESGMTGPDGYISFAINPASVGTLYVTATKPDFYPFESFSLVQSNLPYVTCKEKSIDDASGNSDGIINPGEEITLNLVLKNYGSQTAYGVEAKLRSNDSYTSITDSTGSFGDLNYDAEASESYVFEVNSLCPNSHAIYFDLEITDASHLWPTALTLIVGAPDLRYLQTTFQNGTGVNGFPDPDETVDLRISLENLGLGNAYSSFAKLSSGDLNVQVLGDSVFYGDVPNQESKMPDSCFEIYIDPSCPVPNFVTMFLDINAVDYSSLDSFILVIGDQGFVDDMEGGENGWSHSGTSDKWHLTTHRSHSGNTSWYCGNEGSWLYSSDFTAYLYTPKVIVPPDAKLSFWAWYEIEAGFDYSYCEIDYGEGWRVLCMMTGASGDWVEKTYDLSDYSGDSIQIRFTMFSDDDSYVFEGLYIDDLKVEGEKAGLCGDANGDTEVTVADVVYLVNYLFKSGPEPDPLWVADCNQSGYADIVDAVYLTIYLFKGGPPPCS